MAAGGSSESSFGSFVGGANAAADDTPLVIRLAFDLSHAEGPEPPNLSDPKSSYRIQVGWVWIRGQCHRETVNV